MASAPEWAAAFPATRRRRRRGLLLERRQIPGAVPRGCATPPASASPRPSCAPTSTRHRPPFWDGTYTAGPWRQPFWKPASTSASSPSASGPIWPSHAPPRPCSAWLPHHSVDCRSQSHRRPLPQIGRVVRQGRPHLQRGHRHRPPRTLHRAEFIDIPAKPGKCRNSRRPLAKTHRSRCYTT